MRGAEGQREGGREPRTRVSRHLVGGYLIEVTRAGETVIGLGLAAAGDGPTAPAAGDEAATQAAEYFAGTRRGFTFKAELRGTSFQLAVWRAARAIPYGETRSYGQIAAAIGRPGSARAVGNAMNKNPIMLYVPCHRVVRANGAPAALGATRE